MEQNTIKGKSTITQTENNEIRNALIVGLTGNGKSALANVLTDDNRFVEGNSTTSVTKTFQKSDIFEWRGIKYYVVDNIGFGDTANFSEEDILYRIGEGIHSAKEGINQVFFVFRGVFSPEQVRAFNLLKKFISESRITEFTAIARTHFPNFRNPQRCEEDQKKLLSENKELGEIIISCKKIIYVDNPSIPTIKEGDDEKTKETKKKREQMNKKKREDSRKKVLDYLIEECQEVYKLKEWDNIYSIVAGYIEKEKEIEKRNSSTKEEELTKVKSKAVKEIKARLEVELPVFKELTAAIEHNTQK